MASPIALYVASVLGAVALFLMLPRGRVSLPRLGALLGAMTLGGLWLFLARPLGASGAIPGGYPGVYYYLFSAIAIGAATRVITHTRPIYAALWFVLVILSSAGMFLLLGAEFMAFAMVIIYGGAILVTYVFVIMLAAQAGDPQDAQATPWYDRQAYEPLAAVTVGFILLAVLLTVAFAPHGLMANPAAQGDNDAQVIQQVLTNRPADRPELVATSGGSGASAGLSNAERIGLDLFRGHPLGLELAGVILLVALVGAAVMARQKSRQEEAANPDNATESSGH
jgi:NADH-quinone oxidoreductase subunit J